MVVVENFNEPIENKEFVITIGNFDGLHRGHKKVIRKVISRARELKIFSGLITFNPHPKKFLYPELFQPSILTREEKIDILNHWGLNYYFEINFDECFRKKSAKEFIDNLFNLIKIKEIYVGEDFRFGVDREGDVEFLKSYFGVKGVYCEAVKKLKVRGEFVSSSIIREAIMNGEIEKANLFLGRPFEVRGVVEKGLQRGSKLGFKTANLRLPNKVVLKNGVYATLVDVGEENLYVGVANLGIRPTFSDRTEPLLEIHIVNKDLELYGKEIRCLFLRRIRDEKKFDNVEDLISQIKEDCEKAREIVKHYHLFKKRLFWG